MRITFLGILGSIQDEWSGNTSMVFSEGDASVLVDVSGPPVQLLRRAGIDAPSLDALFLTHSHTDHLYGLPSLIHNLWLLKREKALPVYGNRETIETAKHLCSVFSLEQKKGMFPLEWNIISGGDNFAAGTLGIEVFSADHGVPALGIAVSGLQGRAVYSGDTRPLSGYPGVYMDADILIHEAGGIADEEARLLSGGHSSGRQAGIAAMESQAGRLFLCHLPADRGHCRAILSEARSVFPPAYIPDLFVPYELKENGENPGWLFTALP